MEEELSEPVAEATEGGLPPGSPPVQIFQHLIRYPDQNHTVELNRMYWQMLLLRLNQVRPKSGQLKFSAPERVRFDFGIWCGEQLHNDPEVQEFVDDYDDPAGSPWPVIYAECADQLKSFKVEKPFYTISDWVTKRDEHYRLCAEAEKFIVPKELIDKLPHGASRFVVARNARKKMLNGLQKLISKLPGQQDDMMELVINGLIHDQMDFLSIIKNPKSTDKERLQDIQKIWSEICSKLMIVYKHPNIAAAINRIDDLSQEIRALMLKFRINASNLIMQVRKMYLEEEASTRRLSKDLNLLKHNLNIGALKSSGQPHSIYPLTWPKLVDVSTCKKAMLHCFSLDKTASVHTTILLAPGIDQGFFEFDHGALVIPIGKEDGFESFVIAMADRRYIQETLKDKSYFLNELNDICGEEKPQKYYKHLFLRWLNSEGLKQDHDAFKEEELHFIFRHIAPPVDQLFLRDEEFSIDKKHQIQTLQAWKSKTITAKQLPKVAAIFYQSKRYKEAANILGSLAKANGSAKMACAQCHCLKMAKLDEAADQILNKWKESNNSGYFFSALEAWSLTQHEPQG